MESFDLYLEAIITMALMYVPQLLLAAATLTIGLWFIKKIGRLLAVRFTKYKVDVSLQHFLSSLFDIALKVLLVLSIASMIGIEVTSFVAILGAASFAVGMALSGTLQNFAGGVMILIFKPFKVGDFIEAQGFAGTVKQIQIFNTILTTGDNRTIIIPNSPLSTQSMVNYSTEANRRVDLSFGISYESSIEHARTIIKQVIHADSRILKTPEALIAVSELAESSVVLTVRIYTHRDHYWGVYFSMNEKVKEAFDREEISIPYAHRVIKMMKES